MKFWLTGREGRIESSFGTGGKFKCYFPEGIGLDQLPATPDDDGGPKGGKKKPNKPKLKSRYSSQRK